MYAQAVRIPPVHLRGKRIQSSASEQCAKGCAFPDVQLDCIKYLKLGEPRGGPGEAIRGDRLRARLPSGMAEALSGSSGGLLSSAGVYE